MPRDLAPAAREDEHRFPGREQSAGVLTSSVNGPEMGKKISPDGDPKMLTLAERTHEDSGASMDVEHEKGDIEQAERRVIADQDIPPVGGQVLVTVESGIG
jgi:hypothetical protein